MGAVARGALFVVGLLLVGVAWEVSALIFAYLFIPHVIRLRRRGVGRHAPRWGRWTRITGVLLLGLAALAVVEGGRVSPFAFAVPGGILLVPGSRVPKGGGARGVKGSILQRSAALPFRWYAVAEMKVATRDPARALSGVEGTILLRGSPSFKALAILRVTALTAARAEEKVLSRMRSLADGLTPLGVYVLPLDSGTASDLCTLPPRAGRLAPLQGDSGGRVAILVEARSGEVVAYDLFSGEGVPGTALGRPSRRPASRVFLAEVLRASFETPAPGTDGITSFLAGAAATSGETAGERFTEVTTDGAGVCVATTGGARVALTRAQLAAIVKVYP